MTQAKVQFIASAKLPTKWGLFNLWGFEELNSHREHLALSLGKLSAELPTLLRIHSECLTGDALFSLRCDCGAQLQAAMEMIAKKGSGVVIYLRQEGRGIGLLNKIQAYALQDDGADTVEANEKLGYAADHRNYGIAVQMLRFLKLDKLQLMTNNPHKIEALNQAGFKLVKRIPMEFGKNPHNVGYLATKADKLGHLLGGEVKQ